MASTINATTSSGIVATADNTGQLALQANGTTVMTVTSTGVTTQVGAPAFSAYLSANQTGIANSTWTKITLNAKEWDTNSNFDATTNYRFTPTVAGYYQINGSISFNASTTNPTFCRVGIYKNGALYKLSYLAGSTLDRVIPNIATEVYFNGSTDYVELYGFMIGSSGGLFDGGTSPVYTHMSGFLARSA